MFDRLAARNRAALLSDLTALAPAVATPSPPEMLISVFRDIRGLSLGWP